MVNFNEIFSEFNFTAIASASIAQVHKTKLQDGQEVAVKILRPKLEKIMQRDIASLKLLAFCLIFSKFLNKFC